MEKITPTKITMKMIIKNDKGYPDNPDTINLYDKKDNPIEEDLATFYNWRA